MSSKRSCIIIGSSLIHQGWISPYSNTIIAGQVIMKILKGKIDWRNTLQQLERVGQKSVGVCLLTSAFVGMAFAVQFVRELTRLGLNRSVVGVLALAFSRELSPVISAMIKSQVFGAIISIVSCAWGVTTLGGAKGVGESTTSAVVISLVGIFIADFALSCFFFQGVGDQLAYE